MIDDYQIRNIDEAQKRCETLLHMWPDSMSLQSVYEQLKYLRAVYEGKEKPDQMHRINMATLFGREWDTEDERAAQLICEIETAAEKRFGRG